MTTLPRRGARKPAADSTPADDAPFDDAPDAAPPTRRYAEMRTACPVTPLGHRAGRFYFLDAAGDRQDFTAAQLEGRGAVRRLLLHRTAWGRQFFGTDGGSFSHRAIAAWLIAECSREGLFDPAMPIRGPGRVAR